jgi:hypothetical protein
MTDGTHDRFEELLRDAAVTYRRPPAERDMPLDAMWGAIEEETFGGRSTVRTVWSSQWLRIAAALVIGVGIGRVSFAVSSAHQQDTRVGLASSLDSAHVPSSDSMAVPFEAATSRYLGQAAALLIALPAESSGSGTDTRFITRANDLLLTTRLLLDSPPSSDPALRNLLEDLELVLAQVVRLQNNRDPSRRTELELIHQALEQRDVLPRLRSAVSDRAADD